MRKLIKGNLTAELLEDGILTHRFDLRDEETATLVNSLENEVDEVEIVDSDVIQHEEQQGVDYTKSILK